MNVSTRAQVEAMIAERITADPSFRDALLANPRGAIGDLVGVTIPDSVSIELHEESLTTIHLTIPSTGPLSESDLDLAAGGRLTLCQTCLTPPPPPP